MISDPYTIRIFVKDGDAEGVRIIDQMNWTGKGIFFPRDQWSKTGDIELLDYPGVYILSGYSENDEDKQTIYIGEGDGIRNRIETHLKNKAFWTSGIVFVSSNNTLNKSHVQWLEYALVQQAYNARRSKIDNGNIPQEPTLEESEKVGLKIFLKEIYKILPLLGMRAFETPKPIVPKGELVNQIVAVKTYDSDNDTIIVPAQRDGFEKVFLGENCWYSVRISAGMLPKLKWIAAYQTLPIGAITHIAPIEKIEPYGEGGKFQIYFSEPATQIKPIPFGDAPSGAMQGPRYTRYQILQNSKTIRDIMYNTPIKIGSL